MGFLRLPFFHGFLFVEYFLYQFFFKFLYAGCFEEESEEEGLLEEALYEEELEGEGPIGTHPGLFPAGWSFL